MLIRSHGFEFEAPDGWEAHQDGGRPVFHGLQHEELIFSGYVLTGTGEPHEIDTLTAKLLDNAKKGMQTPASHPDLETVWEVRRDGSTGQVECWTTHAQTRDRCVMFSQAAFVRLGAVLLLTSEAPNTLEEHEELMKVLKSVRPVSTN